MIATLKTSFLKITIDKIKIRLIIDKYTFDMGVTRVYTFKQNKELCTSYWNKKKNYSPIINNMGKYT